MTMAMTRHNRGEGQLVAAHRTTQLQGTTQLQEHGLDVE
jgi:hypothetical protein